MILSSPKFVRRRQAGVAAVEAALLLPILVLLLTIPIFFARYFWHYTVAQKAAQDAARYLSTITVAEMQSPILAKAASDIALSIMAEEMGELKPGSIAPVPYVLCGASPCNGTVGGPVPQTVTVGVTVSMFDNIFRAVYTGRYGWPIKAEVKMPYVGN